MTIEELRSKLQALADDDDEDNESFHMKADQLLLDFIGDEQVTTLFNEADKWYS